MNKTETRVRYADTDEAGVVYYGAYARWLEIGREELLRENGISYKEYADKGIHAPVVKLEINYKAPTSYDDLILIETSIEKIGNSSVTFVYRITRKQDNLLLAEAKTVNVFINKKREKVSVPDEVKRILNNRSITFI